MSILRSNNQNTTINLNVELFNTKYNINLPILNEVFNELANNMIALYGLPSLSEVNLLLNSEAVIEEALRFRQCVLRFHVNYYLKTGVENENSKDIINEIDDSFSYNKPDTIKSPILKMVQKNREIYLAFM